MRACAGLFPIVVLIMTASVAAAKEPRPPGILDVADRPAPALELTNLDGEAFNLAEDRGTDWAFVHFWASWCGPCRREMPTIQRMAAKIEDLPLQPVLVNTAETEDTVFVFMASVAPELETLLDRDGLVTQRWQPRGLPATFLVDPEGIIRYMALGGRKWDTAPYVKFLQRITTDGH